MKLNMLEAHRYMEMNSSLAKDFHKTLHPMEDHMPIHTLEAHIYMTMEATPDVEEDANDLRTAIQRQLFGPGFLGPESLIDTWRLEVYFDRIVNSGSIWDNHPNHPVDDWIYEVSNGDTRLGYWDWARSKDEQ